MLHVEGGLKWVGLGGVGGLQSAQCLLRRVAGLQNVTKTLWAGAEGGGWRGAYGGVPVFPVWSDTDQQ